MVSTVKALGYVVVRGPLEPWKSFGTEVLGLQLADGEDPNTVLLKNDERAWRIAVEAGEPAGPQSLAALGLEFRGDADLDTLAGVLERVGVAVREDAELAGRRGVRRLITFADPGGNVVEAYYGATVDKDGFTSPRGVSFVAGDTAHGDFGVGHAFLFTGDAEETTAFYVDHLGFRLSDTISVGPTTAYFLHCNPRHHSIAVVSIPGAPPNGLGHLMLEVSTMEAVGRTLDIVTAQDIPIQMSIGEHSNDRMMSFYLTTPSGFAIEYGWNGRVIDDKTWSVDHYEAPSIWGHHFQTQNLQGTP